VSDNDPHVTLSEQIEISGGVKVGRRRGWRREKGQNRGNSRKRLIIVDFTSFLIE
jgi:hypothetical protein